MASMERIKVKNAKGLMHSIPWSDTHTHTRPGRLLPTRGKYWGSDAFRTTVCKRQTAPLAAAASAYNSGMRFFPVFVSVLFLAGCRNQAQPPPLVIGHVATLTGA